MAGIADKNQSDQYAVRRKLLAEANNAKTNRDKYSEYSSEYQYWNGYYLVVHNVWENFDSYVQAAKQVKGGT